MSKSGCWVLRMNFGLRQIRIFINCCSIICSGCCNQYIAAGVVTYESYALYGAGVSIVVADFVSHQFVLLENGRNNYIQWPKLTKPYRLIYLPPLSF